MLDPFSDVDYIVAIPLISHLFAQTPVTDSKLLPILPADSAHPQAKRSREVRHWRQIFENICLIGLFAATPALIGQFTATEPTKRDIHVEAFRYGKEPSVIRVNRGDEVRLTFSTRDTAHSFFLEEFDVDAKISPGSDRVAVFRTSAPSETPVIKKHIVLVADHPGWQRYFVSKSLYRCHIWCGPMHAFEHGNLIIWPNTLLLAGLGVVFGIPVVGLLRIRHDNKTGQVNQPEVTPTDGADVFEAVPFLKTLMKRREFQFAWLAVGAGMLYLVILTSLFGSHVAGRNFGVMMTWVVWMFLLTMILTPLGGRIWCMACPLPLLGDVVQRRTLTGVRIGETKKYNNDLFGLNLAWPKWLSNDWPRMVSFLGFGTFSSALVADPRASGFGILGLFVLATVMSPVFELRAFCRYLCPVTGFIGLYSRTAKLALRVKDVKVCDDCKVHTCELGSAKGWACPFGLCAADINENNDCGMCTECIKTCTYDNVTLWWRPFAHERHVRSFGEAWLTISMFVVGTAYCFVHLGHWPFLRDCVNILDKGNWGLFAGFIVTLWSIALLIVPGVLLFTAAVSKRLSGSNIPAHAIMRACTNPLVPMGLAIWMAFVLPMLTANVTFVWQSMSDPFGWGWNLFGAAGSPWHQLWPKAIPWIQVTLVLGGLAYALRNAWHIWLDLTGNFRQAIYGLGPIAACLALYASSMICFYAN